MDDQTAGAQKKKKKKKKTVVLSSTEAELRCSSVLPQREQCGLLEPKQQIRSDQR